MQIKLEICFPLPYECLVWNYKKDDVAAITKALDLNKTVRDQVFLFDQVLMNIFTMYPTNVSPLMIKIPCGWITAFSKKFKKNSLFKQYLKNGKIEDDYQNLQVVMTELSENITEKMNVYNFHLSQV